MFQGLIIVCDLADVILKQVQNDVTFLSCRNEVRLRHPIIYTVFDYVISPIIEMTKVACYNVPVRDSSRNPFYEARAKRL